MHCRTQDKQAEKSFFQDAFHELAYDVFTPRSNRALIDHLVSFGGLKAQSLVLDLGCGTGVFTDLLSQVGLRVVGVDLSHSLLLRGRLKNNSLLFINADAEKLPFPDACFDHLFLSCIIHHLPDPRPLLKETFRVLKPGGSFVSFDPNRKNPFMWLFRDRQSPFYISSGVTKNEQPIDPRRTAALITAAGFEVSREYMTLEYQYVGSALLKLGLPIYYTLENVIMSTFRSLEPHRAFVLFCGRKKN